MKKYFLTRLALALPVILLVSVFSFALVFLAYTVVSLMLGIPYGFDIVIACVGILIAALSTLKIKL